jgi:hypothetical protein
MNKENHISCFAVSFSKGFKSPNIPLATFYQGDKELIFLLDTGSENNVTNQKTLSFVEHTILKDANVTHTLSGVGGTEEVFSCSISFGCDSEQYTENFLVSNSIDAAIEMIRQEHGIIISGILGSQFLKKNNVVMDFNTLMAYSKK